MMYPLNRPAVVPIVVAIVVMIPVVFLSACALGGGQTPYRLIAPEVDLPEPGQAAAADRTLAVSRPEADRTRDSTRILVRRGRSLMPWKGAAWIDRAPDLLQGLLVRFLDGRVATVGRTGSLPAEFRLELVMRRFEMVERSGGLEAETVMVVRLFDAVGRLLAVNTLEGRVPASGESLDASVTAMEAAMGEVFTDLSDWLQPKVAKDSGQ
ncbi:ABC-type transport auxiliary lipoprotein family protein [Wenzhouxiangella sp. EGI_FJ10305]|uniref:ABC-type transport auxiliary lipoprotein family protein n=1 Tax=Wenzhouxiangella sp. EGI_FJ10305 TaxID=3243768 RepID=UPI0035DC0DA1